MRSNPAFRTREAVRRRPEGSDGHGAAAAEEGNHRASIYLHPGQVFATAEPCAVTTILGSCVAVCLWDPLLHVGGANHFLLPYWAGAGQSSARFGNVAVEHLLAQLRNLGSEAQHLQGKLFGGACVIEAFRNRGHHLGLKNVQIARKILTDRGIPIVAEDVGGQHGRKLIFHVDDGSAWIRRL